MKRTDQITQRVRNYCESQGMLSQGDKILLGVSGGADSVCLLFLLREMKEQYSLKLRVVHVNHGIRKEAEEDATFVRELCKWLGIPFKLVSVSVPAIAQKEGLSEEEAGRKARYEAFERIAAAWMAEDANSAEGTRVKIALAHHAGDRAETLLFHLFRGSGLKGLSGIPPMRETGTSGVSVIRPLLCLEREEIEEYLQEKGASYVQDSTNGEDVYARNRIRHHVIPYAEQEICKGVIRHLNQAAETIFEAEEYLSAETQKLMEDCVTGGKRCGVNVERFLGAPVILQKRVIMEILRRLSPERKDLGSVHEEAVRDLFSGGSGRSVNLPFGIIARREYDVVTVIREKEEQSAKEYSHEVCVSKEALVTVDFCGEKFEFQRFERKNEMQIPQKTYTKWFDYDKIKDTLSIRNRREGDFLMIRGAGGTAVRKPLKEYFITEKIPREIRSKLPLLTMGQHVLWIPGHRISESFKVDEETRTILQVRLIKEWDEV